MTSSSNNNSMRLTRISRIRGMCVFRDFTWPTDLPDFDRYNLIYGWNGSGKTTISGVLRMLQAKQRIDSGEVTLRLDGVDVPGHEFPDANVQIRVFSRHFIEANVFRSEGSLDPIYVLGEESVEKQKQIEELRAQLVAKRQELQSARGRKTAADNSLDSHCVDQARLIKELLRSPGANPYNNYNKTNYRDKAEQFAELDDVTDKLLDEDERDRLTKQTKASPKASIDEVTYDPPDLVNLRDRLRILLGTTVVSEIIEALRDDEELSGWVYSGLSLHNQRESPTCLFCNQPLPPNRIEQLEKHFSDEYAAGLAAIDRFVEELDGHIERCKAFELPNKAELYEHLQAQYTIAEADARQALTAIADYLALLRKAAETKKSAMFSQQTIDEEPPKIDDDVCAAVNGAISKHNAETDEFQEIVCTARKRLEEDAVARQLDRYKDLRSRARDAAKAVQKLVDEIRELERQIKALETEIIEHRGPAEELNKDLADYLGHDELQLEVHDTGYRIVRHGEEAKGLSEGERTAVAILYFLKSLRDRSFDLSQGIVVLDDPVSSLDANALFYAFGFIRDRTEDAHQLIILTHNFPFFRQVRFWFQRDVRGPSKKNKFSFYMLDCVRDDGRRASAIKKLDPLLVKYESEYHYLFACVYRAALAPPSDGLERFYYIPNVARRLLEAFLAFRYPKASSLREQMNCSSFDRSKKLRILRFLHAYSHRDQAVDGDHDPTALSEARPVLTDLLAMFQHEDNEHYSGMVSMIAELDAEGGGS